MLLFTGNAIDLSLLITQHPDMYERAVLRKPVGKTFGATVDLWSIGNHYPLCLHVIIESKLNHMHQLKLALFSKNNFF